MTEAEQRPRDPPAALRLTGQALSSLVARFPALWPILRRPTQRFFDRIASGWDQRVAPDSPEHLGALAAALERLESEPRRILDLGTGTGAAALWLARRFPAAEVVGIDISERMVEAARAKLPEELAGRVGFRVADAADPPFADRSFDLITQVSVPVFFDAVTRLLAPDGHVVIVSSLGARTPFHTPESVVRRGFARRGIGFAASGAGGRGTFLTFRRPPA